jgi:phosphatidate cytidylyltransferase
MNKSEEAPGAYAGRASVQPAASAAKKPFGLNARLADLGPRLGSAAVLIAVAIISLWVGGLTFFFVWLAAALVVHFEWQRIVGGAKLPVRIAFGSAALIATAIGVRSQLPTLSVLILIGWSMVTGYQAEPGRRLWAALGVLYAGGLIVAVLTLRSSFPFGRWAIGWLFALVWGTDASAYFAGRLIGGPKFMPNISPSKTWSGTAVGIFAGALIGLAYLGVAAHLSQLDTLIPNVGLFFVGLILAAVSQVGDLFESWMKRRFGAKDSGHFIPGHGGLMDRVDGFIAAAVFAALIGWLRTFPTPAEGLFHWM